MKAEYKYSRFGVIIDVYPYKVEADGRVSFKEIGNVTSPVYTQDEIEFIKED